MFQHPQSGFTFTELATTIAVVAVMTTVILPSFMGVQDKAHNARLQANCKNVQVALEQYAVDNGGRFPSDLTALFASGPYIAGNTYPHNPWGPLYDQDASSSIAADLTHDVGFSYGRGVKAVPTSNVDFGAIAYSPTGPTFEGYVLAGTGKSKADAILTCLLKR